MSELGRISGVFMEPRPAFRDIAGRPTWIVPVVLSMIVSLAFIIAMASHIGWEQMVRQGIESSSSSQSLTPEQRDQQIRIGTKVAPFMAYGGAVLGVPVFLLITAGAVMLLPQLVFGAGLRFKQVFALVSYASLPGIIRTLEVLLVMMLKPAEDFDPNQGTIFDLSFYLGTSAPKWLHSLGGSLDLFSIWVMLLIATALSAASRKLSWAQGFASVLTPWLLYVLIKVGIAALRG